MGRKRVLGWLVAAGTVAAGALTAPGVKAALRKGAVSALAEGLIFVDRSVAWLVYTREEWEDIIAQARYERSLTSGRAENAPAAIFQDTTPPEQAHSLR